MFRGLIIAFIIGTIKRTILSFVFDFKLSGRWIVKRLILAYIIYYMLTTLIKWVIIFSILGYMLSM